MDTAKDKGCQGWDLYFVFGVLICLNFKLALMIMHIAAGSRFHISNQSSPLQHTALFLSFRTVCISHLPSPVIPAGAQRKAGRVVKHLRYPYQRATSY